MKILVTNDFFQFGGAEYIANVQCEILRKAGNDVTFLTYDSNLADGWNKVNHYNIKMSKNALKKIFNKLFFNPYLYYRIKKIYKKIDADVIMVHSFVSSPITQYMALGNRKVIQTVHDFFYFCPKFDCIDENNRVCAGTVAKSCVRSKCTFSGSKLKLIIYRLHSWSLENIRKKKIALFISPSECLGEYLSQYKYKNKVINNPFPLCVNESLEEKGNNKSPVFLYVGKVSAHKGIYKFIDAFKNISDQGYELRIIGDYQTPEDKNKLANHMAGNARIKYLGKMVHNEVLNYMLQCKYLVVPSLWMENYATVILEGFSRKILVVGSDRGGNKEMLSGERGFTFDIQNEKDIICVLEKLINLPNEKYNKIVQNGYKYVLENNSEKRYLENLMNVINEVK